MFRGHSPNALCWLVTRLPAQSANCWVSNLRRLDVHYSSGVANHFFYLLAEGSSPINGQPSSPTCNGAAVKGNPGQGGQNLVQGTGVLHDQQD
jgi:hypothetical protein